MNEYASRPNLPDYVSIKEAARILGISDKRVYEYVDEGRLPSMWAADVIMIPLSAVENFKRRSSGRPRKSIPSWRISSGDNAQFMTSITVKILDDQREAFIQQLERIRRQGSHTFPGTVTRFVVESETVSNQIEISLVWRQSVMPTDLEKEQALEVFRQELAGVLDWDTAQYSSGKVLMHT